MISYALDAEALEGRESNAGHVTREVDIRVPYGQLAAITGESTVNMPKEMVPMILSD